jgi:hypothetical protein
MPCSSVVADSISTGFPQIKQLGEWTVQQPSQTSIKRQILADAIRLVSPVAYYSEVGLSISRDMSRLTI